MIKDHVIARRYAKGLFLSLEKENFNKLKEELLFIANIYAYNSDFKRLLLDPAFLLQDKKNVLDKIAKQANLGHALISFIEFLLIKNRIKLLPQIFFEYCLLLDKENNILRVQLQSFSMLSEEEVFDIKNTLSKIKKQEIIIEQSIDKELLGGIRLNMAGVIFDASIKHRLSMMKERLLQQV